MERAEYERYLSNTEMENMIPQIMSIFDFFEDYFNVFIGMYPAIIDGNDEATIFRSFFESTRERLNHDELSWYISQIGEELQRYVFFRPIQSSLSANVNQYLTMRRENRNDKKNAVKFLKVLCSMYCFTRTVVNIQGLYDVKLGRTQKQVVLAVGTCKKSEPIYRTIKDEVEAIWETAIHSDQAYVIPELACSFGVFKSLLNEFNYSIVHVAGHGDYDLVENRKSYYLEYLDSPVIYSEFISSFSQVSEYVILNCCFSYSFANGNALPCSNYTIAHQEPVGTNIAKDLAKDFYDFAWNQGYSYLFAASQAIATANSQEIYPKRYWLLKTNTPY